MKKLLTFLLLIVLTVAPMSVDAKSFSEMMNVPLDKVFTISFSTDVDFSTVNTDNIEIFEVATGTKVNGIILEKGNTNKKVLVSRDISYKPNTKYVLKVKNIKSAKGKFLKTETTRPFTTGDVPAGIMKVHYLDVGQGDSTLIQFADGKNVLIDGGTREYGPIILNYLAGLGIKHLDYVVATHPDADHIGGLIDVVNGISIGTFLDSAKVHTSQTSEDLLTAIDNRNINFDVPSPGDILFYDKAADSYLQVLYVNSNAADNNDASIALKAGLGTVNFMFMADASKDVESLLLRAYDNVEAQILKAGHHGSNTSSSLAFLRAVKPEAVVLSYGADNSYGHPHKEVTANIAAVGARTYETAKLGNVIVTTNGLTYSVSNSSMPKPAQPEPQPKPTPEPEPKPIPEPQPEPKPIPEPQPQPEPTPEPEPTPPSGNPSSGYYVIPGAPTSFQNCTALREYYPNGVANSHPAYASKHDRDKDGWACER